MLTRLFGAAVSGALLFTSAFSQSLSTQEKFEAADVHLTPRVTSTAMRTSRHGDRYELHNATMVDLVRSAYSVDVENVVDGPSWVEFDRFEVEAKAPSNLPSETLKSSLKALLADRFKLAVHEESRPMQGFALAMGKGKHKLKEADPSGQTGCQTQGSPLRIENGVIRAQTNLVCHNISMQAFAAQLRTFASGYVTSAVVDATELKGSWDFDLKFTPKGIVTDTDNLTLFDAIDKQLGLKLEERSLPRTVLVIDHAERKPAPNPPDTAAKMPPLPPPEFEVAVVKPIDPKAPRQPALLGIQPGGRVNLPAIPLRLVMSLAWNSNTNDEIIGLPKWAETASFDIVGKVPAEYAPTTGNGSIQDIAPMLQSLIAERFQMKSHYEDRPVTAYTLVASKQPKLKKADPATRTGCKTVSSGAILSLAAGNGAAPLPSTQVTCRNITMAEFVTYLPVLAPSYTRYPVVDGTGLEGAWDFQFSYTAINPTQLAGLRGAPPPGAQGVSAADPVGGTTLFDAIEKNLGLKLEPEKRSYPMFVIDHMEEKPLDN